MADERSASGATAPGGRPTGEGPEAAEEAPAGKACDFCGSQVATVHRVALDSGYERLRTPHRELYGCLECSDRKEQSRLGLDHRS